MPRPPTRTSQAAAADFPLPAEGPRSNLVIVRAGGNSRHDDWMAGAGQADFDLLVAAYEPRTDRRPGEWSIAVPGPKISGYYEIFRRAPELLDRYEYIAFFDDDIHATKEDLSRLFEIGRRYKLDLYQPSLSWDSYFSYAATLTNSGKYILRYCNIVEMMCPVFSVEYLRKALPLFALGYETGIDLVWTRLTTEPWFRYAIIDDVVVKHTRPVGATKTRQGFAPDEPYDRQIQAVLDRFGAQFLGFVTYAAIDRRGNAVLSRCEIAFASVSLWAAWRSTPMRLKHFARFVTDYGRHCTWRPINLDPIDIGLAIGRAAGWVSR